MLVLSNFHIHFTPFDDFIINLLTNTSEPRVREAMWDAPQNSYRPMPYSYGDVCEKCWMRYGRIFGNKRCEHSREGQ